MVTPMVKLGHTEVERIWVSAPRARCVSGEWTGGTGCPREGDQNCAQSEGGLGEEVYQRPQCSAQARARGCYFGRNFGTRLREELKRMQGKAPDDAEFLVFGIDSDVKHGFTSACEEAGIEDFHF